MIALISLVLAADPTRCVVSWSGPAAQCAVRGAYIVEGTGPSRRAAEWAAREQMSTLLSSNAALQMQMHPGYRDEDFSRCDYQAAHAQSYCFAAPELAEEKYCFVTFDDKNCWDGSVLTVEAPGWRVLDMGRESMCSKVNQYQVELNYSNVDLRRLTCRARCEEQVRVSCPE